jgi:hypothetical protein
VCASPLWPPGSDHVGFSVSYFSLLSAPRCVSASRQDVAAGFLLRVQSSRLPISEKFQGKDTKVTL